MIESSTFCKLLEKEKVTFFTGVPDSLLKPFCAYLSDTLPSRHLIAANEGGAVALAAGHTLATGNPALVYMQNSGQGNALNPLVSLADPAVYGIPMLLLIGWRGEPGVPDEPQHMKQGAITTALCETLGIPCRILPDEIRAAEPAIQESVRQCQSIQGPVALVVKSGTFAPYSASAPAHEPALPSREAVIEAVAAALPEPAALIATTGHISRELYEVRNRAGLGHSRDFLTVGSMGHASQIALGIAREQPDRPVLCLDGDGALLMHMGAMAIIGSSGPSNFVHLLLNNGAHGSVGGQPTAGFAVDFVQIAKACGYAAAFRAATQTEITEIIQKLDFKSGPVFVEIRVGKTARKDLGRPVESPSENKQAFMERLR